MEIKKNESWQIISRGFEGTIKVLENTNTNEDMFIKAQIVEGTKDYMSSNRYKETVGDELTFRTDLTKFKKRVDN